MDVDWIELKYLKDLESQSDMFDNVLRCSCWRLIYMQWACRKRNLGIAIKIQRKTSNQIKVKAGESNSQLTFTEWDSCKETYSVLFGLDSIKCHHQ